MKVLVIGSGGREHALAWKLAQSERVSKVYVAPGNGGTARDAHLENLPIQDLEALCQWAGEQKIDLTVVGPEAPLAAGVVDRFRAAGLRIFGPTQAAAQLESSKAFSKAFMQRHGIPTAAFDTFTDPVAAHAFIDRLGIPIATGPQTLAYLIIVTVVETLIDSPKRGEITEFAGAIVFLLNIAFPYNRAIYGEGDADDPPDPGRLAASGPAPAQRRA